MPRVQISLLGPVRLGQPPQWVPLNGGKARAVLAALALRHGQTVETEQLIDDLWPAGRAPLTARNAVHVYVCSVRRSLRDAAKASTGTIADTIAGTITSTSAPEADEAVRIESRPGGYRLHSPREQIDWHYFEHLAEYGHRAYSAGDCATAERYLTQALALWTGEPLSGVGDVPLALQARAEARAWRLRALSTLIETRLMGDPARPIPQLTRLVHENPLDERFAAQLLRALAMTGHRAQASEFYLSTRRHLIRETGLEPGITLRQLYQELVTDVHQPAARRPGNSPSGSR